MRRPSKFRLDRYGVETIYRVGFQDNRWHCREQSWTRSIVPVTGFLKEMFTRRGRSYSKHKETVSLMLQRDEKDAQNLFSTISSGITIDQFFISVLLLVGRKKRGWSACGMSLVTSALLLEVVMKYCLKDCCSSFMLVIEGGNSFKSFRYKTTFKNISSWLLLYLCLEETWMDINDTIICEQADSKMEIVYVWGFEMVERFPLVNADWNWALQIFAFLVLS